MSIFPALTRHLRTDGPFGAIDRVPTLGMPVGERTFEVFNPATGELLAELPDMGVEETRAAIGKAYVAQAEWAANRRVARTRAMLHQTLMSLILKRG